MALQTAATTTTPAPHVVGNAFVHQYYHVLLTSPALVHRFYQDSSILSRPDCGVITPAVNDKLFSYNFIRSEIESIDSQASHHNGVIIVVTGFLTDNNRRKFTQTFFLAPQDIGGFFVRNDIFRFLDQPGESNQIVANGINGDAPTSPPNLASEVPNLVKENQVGELTSSLSESLSISHEEVVVPSENGSARVEVEPVIDPTVQTQSHEPPSKQSNEPLAKQSRELPVEKVDSSVAQENGHKKSYASILKVAKVSPPKKPAYVPTAKTKAPAKNASSTEKPVNVPTTPAPALETKNPDSKSASEINNSQDATEGYSVYIKNLPVNATADQVELEMKKFGTIKPGGVQVRNHKIDRFCFGFVEFELEAAMRDAIKASPITMGGRQVFISGKRTTTRVVNGVVISNDNGRGRFPQGRGGFRNENFRPRGNFTGNNQGYRRQEFSGHGRGRAPPGHFRESYQHRAIQNGNGRIIRPLAVNNIAVKA